eukprot:3418690-Pleurochrysis_carterae.AAC.2
MLWPTCVRAAHLCEKRLVRVDADEPRVGSVRAICVVPGLRQAHRHGGQLPKLCELELTVILRSNMRPKNLNDDTGIAHSPSVVILPPSFSACAARRPCRGSWAPLVRVRALAHLAALERCHALVGRQ